MVYTKFISRIWMRSMALIPLAVTLAVPLIAFAQAGVNLPTAPTTCSQLVQLINNIANLGGGFFLALGVIVFLIAAYYFLFGAGSEDAATKGRQYLTYGVLGIVIALIAYGLPNILSLGFGGGFKLPACV